MLLYVSNGRGRLDLTYYPSRSARRRIASRTNALLLRPRRPLRRSLRHKLSSSWIVWSRCS